MRLRTTLTSLVAAATAVAVIAPLAPAQAVPAIVGSYAATTPTVLRTVDSDGCQEMVRFDVAVDLQGLGNAIAAQGYTTPASGYVYGGTDPVYTKLYWSWEARITGPDNYYKTIETPGGTSFPEAFPTSVTAMGDTVCPDDFGRSRTSPGAYQVAWTATFETGDICSRTEGCRRYEPVFQQTGTTSYTLAYSAACLEAKA